MAKLRARSEREVFQILAEHGFVEVRRRGSHIAMQRRTATGTVTVPVPDHHEIRLGTLQSIIRQNSIAHSEFESQGESAKGGAWGILQFRLTRSPHDLSLNFLSRFWSRLPIYLYHH